MAKHADATGNLPTARRWWKAAMEAKPPNALDRAEVHASLARVAETSETAETHRRAAKDALSTIVPVPEWDQPRVAELRATLRGLD